MGSHRDAVVVALALAPALLLVASIAASPTVKASMLLLAPALALSVAIAACWITARHVRGRARLVWRLFALSLGAWALTGLAAAVITALGQEIQTVGPLDVGWFALYPPMIVALALTYDRLRPERGWQGAIDSLALVLALSLPVWLLVIAPALDNSARPLDAVSVFYPALDLAALGAVGWLAIRYGSRVPGWLAWIAAALACQVIANIVYARFTLVDATTVATASSAMYLMAAVLWTAAARARRRRPERYWGLGTHSLPPAWSGILPLLAAYASLVTAFAIGSLWAFGIAAVASLLAAVRLLQTQRINAQLITERERLIMTDPLTGAHNRRFLDAELARSFARALRTGEPIALISFDIDRFKAVNDGHGHGAGDELLCAVTARITDVVRVGDSLCRVGGDEFVLVAPDIGHDPALAMAERVRLAVSRAGEEVVPEVGVTASVGVALSRDGAVLPEDLLALADSALYKAKDAGRNCVRVAIVERALDSPLPPPRERAAF
jgi:two-component system, cell cycle response regulator